MAKTISIDPSHVYTSRGDSMTVREALAWVADNMTDEEGAATYSPADLIVYGVRRLMALHKDGKRYGAGKLASRFYAPRLDNLSDKVRAPKPLVTAVAVIHEVAERAHAAAPASKPAPVKTARKAPASKPAPAPAAPVKTAPPVVRKHAAK